MPPPRLSIIDILHRTFVTGCVGVTFYGGYLAWSAHTNIMQRSKEAWEKHEREIRGLEQGTAIEDQLAAAAQEALSSRKA
ncbi:hypothetical protein CPB86DRAFT_784493 [Serendipita vermifera]|nr:hypothetical protein CPB86DRAFT_784493 [Serendipita vermifera]